MGLPPPGPPAPPALRLAGISKRFGALKANDEISLELARGEVLALLGENGAGKSTLVSILFGHYVADAGTIEVDGRPLPPGQPRAALDAGIGMVHQHFALADNLSVLDNVMLGSEPLWQPWSRRRAARRQLLETGRRFGLEVDPDAGVAGLSVGERQRVEILKALVPVGRRRGARILILDEPTAVLTPQESERLFATLRGLVAEGLSIVFISHKLDEVLAVSQRIAVLRAGRLVAEMPSAGVDKAMLAEAMVGRRVAPAMRRGPRGAAQGPAAEAGGVVDAADVANAPDAAPWVCELDDPALQLRAGEVVAIAGVSGNGQQALADRLCGLVGAGLRLDGHALAPRPRAFVEAGVARIPEDRQAVGVVGDLSIAENAVLERYRSPAFARGGWIRSAAVRRFAGRVVERFDVRGGGLGSPARALSGGNMQKLILGRALLGAAAAGGAALPRLIVAHQPTWGLDVGAVAFVHQQLLDAADAGSAVLLISEDLDEIFALADRIAVMHAGRLGAARPRAEWSLAQIGLAMAGAQAGPDGAAGTGAR